MFDLHGNRARREARESAAEEVRELRARMERAERLFNSTADSELLEASILELRALQTQYGCALRRLKLLNGDTAYDASFDPRPRRSRGDCPEPDRHLAAPAENAC